MSELEKVVEELTQQRNKLLSAMMAASNKNFDGDPEKAMEIINEVLKEMDEPSHSLTG